MPLVCVWQNVIFTVEHSSVLHVQVVKTPKLQQLALADLDLDLVKVCGLKQRSSYLGFLWKLVFDEAQPDQIR